jgi:hypothetical protein
VPLQTFFYPRITYTPPGGSQTIIDFEDNAGAPATPIIREVPVESVSVALSGADETLSFRTEYILQLILADVPLAKVTALQTYFRAMRGRQVALTLDRLATCAGQWEYDTYNTFFTKAVLQNPAFDPSRLGGTNRYVFPPLVFRQSV